MDFKEGKWLLKMNDIVLDRVTNENKSECCDFVVCNNCGRVMLINHGKDTCPECDCKETLSWVEEDFEEINYDNAPDVLAGMGYTLYDTEKKDGCNLRKTCKGCCPPIGICNKPWVN